MGACSGLLFGEVYSAKGAVTNAMVDIDWIKGETTGSSLSISVSEDNEKAPTYVLTDSDTRRVLEKFGHNFAEKPAVIAAATGIAVEEKTGVRLGAVDSRGDGKAVGY